MRRRISLILIAALACLVTTTSTLAQLARQWVSRTAWTGKIGQNAAVVVRADDSG